ncbi:MAG: transketolase [Clostridia bacterium]|nr:transketolase [Clostridia bacterium]MBR2295960.1 transketolase [Clostridia bacterium]
MNNDKILELKKIATDIRIGAIEAVHSAKSGHPGGALSCADILACLYFSELKIDPENPENPERDRFVLSKGHSCPALYSAMALRGYFDLEELKKFRHLGSVVQGHPDMKAIRGIDMSAGSLGQGFSCACGMALAGKIDKKDYRVYSIIGDGESQEGQIWEAIMFAAHYKLDNLCLIIDNNGLQIDGKVKDVMNTMPYASKLKAFGWNVISIDGHSIEQILDALSTAKTVKGKPTVIVAKTIKGKGVSFMEDQAGWHGKAPNDDEYAQAINELTEYKNSL